MATDVLNLWKNLGAPVCTLMYLHLECMLNFQYFQSCSSLFYDLVYALLFAAVCKSDYELSCHFFNLGHLCLILKIKKGSHCLLIIDNRSLE